MAEMCTLCALSVSVDGMDRDITPTLAVALEEVAHARLPWPELKQVMRARWPNDLAASRALGIPRRTLIAWKTGSRGVHDWNSGELLRCGNLAKRMAELLAVPVSQLAPKTSVCDRRCLYRGDKDV